MNKTDLTRSIQNWLQGDEKEFTVLFYHFHAKLSQFSEKFLSDRQLVEELVMNVLFKIWKARRRITDPSTFNAYLYSAMRNEIISSFRRKKMALTPLETVASEPVVNTEYEYRALLEEYDSCVEKLPPKRRQIFLMSRRQGMTYPQIAKELNISLNTVQKQVGAALRTIRKELNLPDTRELLTRSGIGETSSQMVVLVLLGLLPSALLGPLLSPSVGLLLPALV